MPFVKIWVHIVWSTKNRQPFLTANIRKQVFQHIRDYARSKGIFVDFIGGHIDHVHCLLSLGIDQSVAKIVRSLKGESSFWINKQKLTKTKFVWQDEYFAVSVGHTALDSVRRYIANQEEHHSRHNFDREFREFLQRAGFEQFG